MNTPPISFQVNAVTSLISLAHTRLRVRQHPHPERGPETVKRAREHAIAMLADAAALGALPLSRNELRQWATWIEGGAEDRSEDLVLARRLMRGLSDGVRALLEVAIAQCPRCIGQCPCETEGCSHTCAQHDLGGGACGVAGCKCSAHFQRTRLAQLFHDAHELAAAPPLPVNADEPDDRETRSSGVNALEGRETMLPSAEGA